MKAKCPFYKNGMIIGAVLFVLALGMTQKHPDAAAFCGVAGMIIFFVSLIRRIIGKLKGKKKDPEVVNAPSTDKPTQVPIQQPQNVDNNVIIENTVPKPETETTIQSTSDAETQETNRRFVKITTEDFVKASRTTGYVAFDFETTGLSSENDRIVEIGAIKVDAYGKEIDRFSTLINPEMHLPSNVASITGLSDAILRTAPTLDKVLPDFLRFIDGYPLIAWNVSFDKGFLEKAVCRCNLNCETMYADALAWARKVYDLPSYKQDAVSDHIGYVPTTKHRAMADCETMLAIISDMLACSNCIPQEANSTSDKTFVVDMARMDTSLNANAYEIAIAEHFISVIKADKPDANPVLQRRSQSYLSLCLGDNDFLRIKYTDRTKWISIDSWAAQLEDEDPLFIAHENKRQRHWKAKLDDISDVERFDALVVKACQQIKD